MMRWLRNWYGCVVLALSLVGTAVIAWATDRWIIMGIAAGMVAGAAIVWVGEWRIDRRR